MVREYRYKDATAATALHNLAFAANTAVAAQYTHKLNIGHPCNECMYNIIQGIFSY